MIDMDGVLVDLDKEIKEWFKVYPELIHMYEKCPDHIPGIFRNPKPIKGAIKAIHKLYESGKYDMFIATSAPWGNPQSAADKRVWLEKYFGSIFHKKMFVTHRKDLLMGDYLIDDRVANGAGEFSGEHIHFGTDYTTGKKNPYPTWDSVLKVLL